MKKIITALFLTAGITVFAQQNVGIGTNDPKSKLDVKGGLTVGTSYSGVNAAPTDGAIIQGRVGIGTNNPDTKAVLDLNASDKGMYLPRLTNAQAAALGATLTASNNGLLIFNSDTKRAEYWDTNQWKAVGEGAGGPPSGSAGGDLTGTYPNPTLATSGVTANTYGSATTVPTIIVDAKGRITSASNTAISGVAPAGTAGGDLAGTYPNPTVDGLQGRAVAATAPTNGQVLKYNTSTTQWEPATDNNGVGTVTSIATGTGLTGGPITGSGTISIANTGVTAGTYNNVTVNAQGQVTTGSNAAYLTANQNITLTGDVTGSGATSIATTVARLQGRNVAATAPTNGQVLKYNTATTQWEPGTDNNNTYTGGTAISISGTTINNTGVTSVTGTANQVNVNASTGAVTFSLPQNIHTAASPTFANVTATGDFYGRVNVADTRSTNAAPTTYNNEVAFEFKTLSAIGAPGSGTYGGLMTMSPWGDNSGDASHQLFFNEGGIYWRQGQPDNATWDTWSKINTGSVTSIATSGTGIGVVNGDGVSGTPTISLNFGSAVNVAANGKHPVGNFGQFQTHSTYNDFNTVPNHWGWNYVQGATNAPNGTSSQWYREIISLGSEYPGRGTGGYSLELAFPRFEANRAGVWMRTTEGGTIGNWVNISGPPVGSIMAWHKNGTNMPALPDGWVECNGQTLSDAASPLNGTAIPNLNGTFTTEAGGTSAAGRFLRGSTTSGALAADRGNSVTEMLVEDNGGGQASQRTIPDNGSWSAAAYNYYTTGSNDGLKLRKKGVENNPGYMTVVWIMKVK